MQEEKEARQGDASQITELSTQLADALAALQKARAESPTEALTKLQAQLQAAQHALEVCSFSGKVCLKNACTSGVTGWLMHAT